MSPFSSLSDGERRAEQGGPVEFQKFVFRGHKARFENTGPKYNCDACGKGIAAGVMVTAEPFHYHEECCKCGKCGVDLDGEYYKRNQSLLCQVCYEPTCSICSEKIRAGQGFVRYEDKWDHRRCFNCYKCKKKLAIDKFFLVDGKPACEDCGAYLDSDEE